MKAVEFFSGIGAFAEACRESDVEIIAAYDQNDDANRTYAHNFGLKPSCRNLDSINEKDIPRAAVWWMSPPCTPYTVRGKRRDLSDPRAASLLNLIKIALIHLPETIFIENVSGFQNSEAEKILIRRFREAGYNIRTFDLCPTQSGIPMRRPRRFLVLSKAPIREIPPQAAAPMKLSMFLEPARSDLVLLPLVMARYEPGFDIVDAESPEAVAICFTKNYARCMRASGSLLRTKEGVRRFAPEEILKLLGFSPRYQFPTDIANEIRWRLVGNSVDVRAIGLLLSTVSVKQI